LIDKRISLTEAARLVRDGDILALGGLTIYRRPVAFVRELLRRPDPPQDLTLLSFTGGFASDLLVGTGLVGRVFVKLLEARNFPVANIKLLASADSVGKKIEFRNQFKTVALLDEKSFENIHIAFFSAGAAISKRYAPIAATNGTIVIDNSSAFRMDDDVPLIVPEVNAHALKSKSVEEYINDNGHRCWRQLALGVGCHNKWFFKDLPVHRTQTPR